MKEKVKGCVAYIVLAVFIAVANSGKAGAEMKHIENGQFRVHYSGKCLLLLTLQESCYNNQFTKKGGDTVLGKRPIWNRKEVNQNALWKK
jgi:hypothetical protein